MWPYPRLLAHRGAGWLAPENTLAALRLGWERGYRATEFDVMLAGDGVPVLVHDTQLGRTLAGRGQIADFTAAELQRMDAGSRFGVEFACEPVPTYEQAYQFCIEHDIWMNVEIKPVPGTEIKTGKVVAEATRRFLKTCLPASDVHAATPLLSSFSMAALLAAREVAPEIPRALLVTALPADWQARLEQTGSHALHVQESELTRVRAQAVKAAGYGLFCYTVNDLERAALLLSWGVDAFCTDRLDLFDPNSPAFRP